MRTWLLASLTCLTLVAAAAPALAHGSFYDDDFSTHEPAIEAIADQGITQGCTDLSEYCPWQLIPREQMAAFLDRALDLPATDTDHFVDDDDSPFEAEINRIASAGITKGCTSDGRSFCPHEPVPRDQMAAFLDRALDLPATDTDYFVDDDDNRHEDAINRSAEDGITFGCDDEGTRYCPRERVRRDQMASFMQRALDLQAQDPTTGDPELVVWYSVGTEGAPDRGSFDIFRLRSHQALHDSRGWSLDGRIRFRLISDPAGADVRLWLTDDDNVGNKAPVCSDNYSCTVGDDLYINDENFVGPDGPWGQRNVADYQRYVITHEMGHWLDFDQRSHYNDAAYCDADGDAPVMMQQSIPSVMQNSGCATNQWPLGFERDCVEEARLTDTVTQDRECPHQP